MPLPIRPAPVTVGSSTPPSVGPLEPTSKVTRMKGVDAVLAALTKDSIRGVAARGFLLPANAKTEQWLYAYHTGNAKEMNVLSAPPNNKLQLTVTMHVSGHTNEATKFASDPNESFSLSVTGPDGQTKSQQVKVGGSPGHPVYAIAHDIEFDVSKPGNYRVDISPSATSVGGYVEGRRYNVHVGAANFFKPTQAPAGYKPQQGQTYPYPIDEMASLANDIRRG